MGVLSELEKIDMLRERTGVGYAEAKQLLDECNGDLINALVLHEERQRESGSARKRLVEALERLIRQGNVTKLRVRKGERVYAELPVTAGVVGAALAPQLFLLAGIACLVGRCSVEFQRADGANGWYAVEDADTSPI